MRLRLALCLLLKALSVIVPGRLVHGAPLWRRVTAPAFLPCVLSFGPVRGLLLLLLLLTLGAGVTIMPVFMARVALDTGRPSRHRYTTPRDRRCQQLSRKFAMFVTVVRISAKPK